jgi:hypothetical protein
MGEPILNPNQRRRVATHLRLLQEDLEDVASWPELGRPGEPYTGIRDALAGLLAAVADLRGALALPPDQAAPLRRRVMATAEVWATSAEDLKARHLRGYGRVHPDLGAVLDGRIDDIVQRLRGLADRANALPDR